MNITTEKKVNEMLRLGKADNTVQSEYSKLKSEHSVAKLKRDTERTALDNCKENLKNKQKQMSAISFLHPIKKYRAFRAVREAKRQYKIKKNDYKIAKMKLKNAQINLRSMKAEIRNQYSAIKQNEKMNKRMQKIQKGHFTTPSLADMLEFNKQNSKYATQVYHRDNQNSANNTWITSPRDELYSNINKTYAKHLKEKAKAKSQKIARDTMNVVHSIGNKTKSNEPEVEV